MIGRWIPFWAVPTLIVFATGTVWLRLAIVRTTYAINQTNQQMNKVRQESEQVQLKVAALRSPRRLEGLAKTKFGLMQPRMEQVVHLDSSEKSTNGP